MKENLEYSQELFKVHSTGQIGTWKIEVFSYENGEAKIVSTSAKVEGGAEVPTPTLIKTGKNIGRKNETTPLEQALKEAAAKYTLKMKKGYVVDRPKAGDTAVNLLGYPFPMLAQTYSSFPKEDFVYLEPKLDGERMVVVANKLTGVQMYSKEGNLIHLPHIRESYAFAFENNIWSGEPIDGEIYNSKYTLQEIQSLVSRLQAETLELSHVVYDVIRDEGYAKRYNTLRKLVSGMEVSLNTSFPIQLIPCTKVSSEEELHNTHRTNVESGFEGSMARLPHVGYEDGKRSSSLLKIKDAVDEEFLITKVIKGKPYLRGGKKLDLAIYQCVTKDGKVFNATAPGDKEARHKAWVNREDALRKHLTVKHFGYTPKGSPINPIALRIRRDL